MAELDLSHHSLNNSSSKQKFSFPKTQRFHDPQKLCDSFYDAPSFRSSRATSFGYGKKDMGLRADKNMAPVGTYELGTEFKKDQRRGFSFGSGREEMQLGGPLKDTKIHAFIPGPGNYECNRSQLDPRGSSLRVKLPDNSLKYLQKNPGPGAYKLEEMGSNFYYINSKFRNDTNGKISQGSRLSQIARRSTIEVGPGSYTINLQDLNTQGRYKLSNHESSRARVFDRAAKQDLVSKQARSIPGPGQQQFCPHAVPISPPLDDTHIIIIMRDRQGWEGQGKPSQFMAILKQMEKQQEGEREGEVREEVEFDRNDPQQCFYRTLQQLSSKEFLLRKLGWRVVELSREEQDLALYCFSILSAESIIPLNFFTTQQEGRKALWLQIGLHINQRTASQSRPTMQRNIYLFIERRLLPLLRNFVRENINWSRMTQPVYSDEAVLSKFREEVVAIVNEMAVKEDFSGMK